MHRSLAAAAALVLACGGPGEPPKSAPSEGPALPAPEAFAEPATDTPGVAGPPEAAAGPDRAAIRAEARPIFGDLPDEAVSPDDPPSDARTALGRMLYFDPRVLGGEDVSCNSCHPLDRYGASAAQAAPGHGGHHPRNAPSVYNATLAVGQLWDGRAGTPEALVELTLPAGVGETLRAIPGYAEPFAAAFPGETDPFTAGNVARAIAAFERRLITPSRFDAFLEGRDDALSDAEVEGLGHFLALGCIQCHFGSTIGGTSYQKIGRAAPYPTEDLGRFEITKRNSDRFAFKVPSLRNVEETGPWFHDGAAGTLDEAIRWMARYQLGTALSDEVVASLRAFLVSLTGAVDAVYTQPPELPPPASAEGSRREPKASDGEPPEDVS
jgi:cytochrome c peroxidase